MASIFQRLVQSTMLMLLAQGRGPGLPRSWRLTTTLKGDGLLSQQVQDAPVGQQACEGDAKFLS